MIDHVVSYGAHESHCAIFGSSSQAETSDNRDCDIRRTVRNGRMAEIKSNQPEAVEILTRLDAAEATQRELASALDLSENKLSKVRAGERRLQAGEYRAAKEWLDEIEAKGGYVERAELPEVESERAYLPVDILPSYAGMGGGGTGEGDLEQALISRTLIEDELHAKSTDLLLIDVRGESMQPDFLNGDQILIDKRDVNPVQPGAFALWDGDGYVVKMVERIPRERGRYRVFSKNRDFSAYEVDEDEITIMGRPVWFGRRL